MLALVGGTVAQARWIDTERLTWTRRTLRLPGWPASQPPLRVGHLSDFHCDSFGAVKRAWRAAEMLMTARPDIVVLSGDFITSHGEQWAEATADALAATARAPLGVFAVLGNHDHWTESADILARELGRVGILVLRNEPARVRGRGNLWILGVDSIATGAADAKVASLGVPEDAVRILVVHEPDFVDYAAVHAAVQLSGHSHGGQVRAPFLPTYAPAGARKYHTGFYPRAPIPVFVTRGIGTVGIPLRFRCPPEVAVLTLVSGSRREEP